MRRAFAGVLDPRDHHERLAASALRDEGSADSFAAGGLTVAFSGGPAQSPRPVSLLDGDLYEVRQPGLAAGLRAGPGAEQSLPALLDGDPAAALGSLRGDFAILAWDPEKRQGLIARDQCGARGLYWSEHLGRLLFATEVHLLLRLFERRPAPHAAALAHWLATEGIPGDQTMYEGVLRLPPAGFVRLGAEHPAPSLYWDPSYTAPLEAPRDELVSRVRASLETASRRCLRTDDPVGVMLSGGLDSSSVATLAMHVAESGGAPRRGYSAVFPNHPSVDESELIDALSQTVGLPSTRIVVRSGSVLGGAIDYIERWEMPPPSPNLFFWLPLFERAAQDGVRVILDGEGGDEVFGYSSGYLGDLVRRGRLVHAWRMIHRMPGAAPRLPRASARRVLRQYALKGAAPHFTHRAAWRLRPAHYAPRWLREEMARLYVGSGDFASWKRTPGPLWWSFLRFMAIENPALGIAYDQMRLRAAVGGIGPRHPLKDVDLIELALRLPPEAAYDASLSRPLFRDAMAGLLIDKVRLRPGKSSFDAVFHDSLAADLDVARALLLAPDAELRAYVDVDLIDDLELRPGAPPDLGSRQWWSVRLWRLLTAECWLRLQGNRELPRRLLESVGASRADYELVAGEPA